jgi:hypothetical protein
MTADVVLRQTVRLPLTADGGADLVAAAAARLEGRVGAAGWVVPGSLSLLHAGPAVCCAAEGGDGATVSFDVVLKGRARADAVGDELARLPVVMRGSSWGTLAATPDGGLFVFLAADVGEGAAAVDVRLTRVLRRAGEARAYAWGVRLPSSGHAVG